MCLASFLLVSAFKTFQTPTASALKKIKEGVTTAQKSSVSTIAQDMENATHMEPVNAKKTTTAKTVAC